MLEILKQPWPWYVAGPIIGLTVPLLLILGNKNLGVSSSLRHVCAACMPAKVPFFEYDWKKEIWNLFFVFGIFFGGFIAMQWMGSSEPIQMNPILMKDLAKHGITNYNSLVPVDLVNWKSLLSIRGFIFIVVGGFLVGFGTRYAGGCTSGHSIMGLSSLQWPSLIATCCFMAGGIITSNLILPYLLAL
jgi:uncharacterized membrane protein YedE/YeeE